jgi:uncharacterized protein YeaO (DUF488 family)
MTIRLKRAYEAPARSDGRRVLVERLWPRGLTKARARIDLWPKEIAPSPALRKWYSHDVGKWSEFRARYARELRARAQALADLRRLASQGTLTLIYAARDQEHNSALVLKEFLQRRTSPMKRSGNRSDAGGGGRVGGEDATRRRRRRSANRSR